MPTIKERQILFNADMVRALLTGTKTQTRRAMSDRVMKSLRAAASMGEITWFMDEGKLGENDLPYIQDFCPFGCHGDRLWVRESWWQAGEYQPTYPEDDEWSWFGSRRIVYSADGLPPNEPNRHYPEGLRNGAYSAADPHRAWRHRPSIHMPRWASRITLEITDVRVEQLRDISEADAIAEGIAQSERTGGWLPGNCATPELAYFELWEQLYGAESRAANPWVWCVSFKQIEEAAC